MIGRACVCAGDIPVKRFKPFGSAVNALCFFRVGHLLLGGGVVKQLLETVVCVWPHCFHQGNIVCYAFDMPLQYTKQWLLAVLFPVFYVCISAGKMDLPVRVATVGATSPDFRCASFALVCAIG